MTNKKYHRCVRALSRMNPSDRYTGKPSLEYERLASIVSQYRAGGLRAKNGRGSGLHTSGATA